MIGFGSFIDLATNIVALNTKMIYSKVNNVEDIKKVVLDKGIYHVSKEENIDKIIECGYIKPSNHFISLGKKKTFFLLGLQTMTI